MKYVCTCSTFHFNSLTRSTYEVVWVAIFCQVDGLIGLRPARQDPRYKHKTQTHKSYEGVSNNQSLSSNISSPQTTKQLTLTVNFTDFHQICHPVPLLSCTYRFLRTSLKNESTMCQRINQFMGCSTSVLRSEGRRSFVNGISSLATLSSDAQTNLGCDFITASHPLSGRTRHERTKRSSSSKCCTNELLNCAIQTAIKLMSIDRSQQCHILDFYNSCVSSIADTCDNETVFTSFHIYRIQLQNMCHRSR